MNKIRYAALSIAISSLLFSCADTTKGDKKESAENETVVESEMVENQLNLAQGEGYRYLDPVKISDNHSFHVVSQIYESLLRFDEKDLSVKPMLAESWALDEKSLVYTFNLKKGVYFHDNACFPDGKGRELTAKDVVFSFKRVFSNTENNIAYGFFKNAIVGGENFHDSELPFAEKELEGVRAIDDYTVEIALTKLTSNFLQTLAFTGSAIVPEEAVVAYPEKIIVGTGPFIYESAKDEETKIVLTRNPNYHESDKDENQLPYINSVAYHYISTRNEQLTLFNEGKLDMILGLPAPSIKEVVENQISDFKNKPAKYILGRYPELASAYLEFNTTKKPLNNMKVRQAIAIAINKNRIIDDVLKGEAYGMEVKGIVAFGLKGYNYSSINGLSYDVQQAQKLLADAGYPEGKNFPSLKLTTNGKNNKSLRVVLDIQKQLKANLNINVDITSTTMLEQMDETKFAKGDLSLSSWLADAPNPGSFLALVYGGNVPKTIEEPSFPNTSRYKNKQFDKLYEEAIVTMDEKKRNELFAQADQILATETPILPLWYYESYRLTQSRVLNFQPNALRVQNLTRVKLK